jgi:hypothetical protein
MVSLTIAGKVDANVHAQKIEDLPLTFELAGELLGRDLDLGSCIHNLVTIILSLRHIQNLLPNI